MNTLSPEIIKTIRESSWFGQFAEYIQSHIEDLDTTDGLIKLDNARAGELAKVRAITVTVLSEILEPFIVQTEKREPTEDEIKRAKAKAGL